MSSAKSWRAFNGHPVLLAGMLALCVIRVSSANAAQDTPLAADAKATEAPERLLVDWAAKQQVRLSLSVAAMTGGNRMIEVAGDIARNPASVSKLVTALVALERLGPSFRFKTMLHGRLTRGHIEQLVIRGQGDPSFTSDQLYFMAARLSALGLTQIDRAIMVDQSYFDEQFVPPAFEQQPNEWAAFRAPVCATALDKNRLTLQVVPEPELGQVRCFVEPLGAAELTGRIRLVDRETKGGRVGIRIKPGLERPTVQIDGEIGSSESTLVLERRNDDPRKTVGYVLREALRARGIQVPASVTLGRVEGLPSLVTHESDALASLLYRLGKESDNFAAEMLLKTMGAELNGIGSSESGAKIVVETLARYPTFHGEQRWVNGSGLFDANRLSTNLLVDVLAGAANGVRFEPEYLSQLSIAGLDGTLTKRMRQLPTGCLVRAKTGTLRNVISLAGYVFRPDRRSLAFASILEAVKDQAAARGALDRFVEALCSAPIPPP